MLTVGRRIREMRGSDMTQEEFAERIGISQNYLSTMERGKVEIGAEILLRISREFVKSVEWLMTGRSSFSNVALLSDGQLPAIGGLEGGGTPLAPWGCTGDLWHLVAKREPGSANARSAITQAISHPGVPINSSRSYKNAAPGPPPRDGFSLNTLLAASPDSRGRLPLPPIPVFERCLSSPVCLVFWTSAA